MPDNIIPIKGKDRDELIMDAVYEFIEKLRKDLNEDEPEPQTLFDMFFWLAMYNLQACDNDTRIEGLILSTSIQGTSHAMEVLFKQRLKEERED